VFFLTSLFVSFAYFGMPFCMGLTGMVRGLRVFQNLPAGCRT